VRDFEKTPIDFSDALSQLHGWLGKRLTIYVDYGHYAGGASFRARLKRVEFMERPAIEVLMHFEDESAFAHLSPDCMTALRVVNPLTEDCWLEFTINNRTVLTIERTAHEECWISADEPLS
jgi:hypothetical protein